MSQIWSDIAPSDGRTIQIAWMHNGVNPYPASLEVYEMKSIWNHPPAVAVPGSDLPGLTK